MNVSVTVSVCRSSRCSKATMKPTVDPKENPSTCTHDDVQCVRSNQEETVTQDSLRKKAGDKSGKVDGSLLYHHHYHHPNDESSLTFQKSFFSDMATVSQQSERVATKTVHHIHLHHDNEEATRTSIVSNASLRRRRRVGNSEATTRTNDKWSKLENLKMLYNEGTNAWWGAVCCGERVWL